MCHSCNKIRSVFLPILTDLPESMLKTLCLVKYAIFHMSMVFYGYYFTILCQYIFTSEQMDTPCMLAFVDYLFIFVAVHIMLAKCVMH